MRFVFIFFSLVCLCLCRLRVCNCRALLCLRLWRLLPPCADAWSDAFGNNITETSLTTHTIATPSLVFSGAALQSATSGGHFGQHLVITLNGNVYKIALLNP